MSVEEGHFISSRKMHSTSGELCLVASFPPLDSKKVMFVLTSYAQLLTKIPPKCNIKGIINLDNGTAKVEQKYC